MKSVAATPVVASEAMDTPVVEAHGTRIPLIGLGTWNLRGSTCVRMVEQALRLLSPCRHRGNVRQRARGRRGPARLRPGAGPGVHHHEDMAVAFRRARTRACGQGEPGAAAAC